MTPIEMVAMELRKSIPGISIERAQEAMGGCDLFPHMDGREMTGVKILKGTEFHFVASEKFKLNRKALRDSLAMHIDRFGFLTTKVEHADKANQRFNKLFGFQPTWADDKFQYFILTELPFKDKSCQQ